MAWLLVALRLRKYLIGTRTAMATFPHTVALRTLPQKGFGGIVGDLITRKGASVWTTTVLSLTYKVLIALMVANHLSALGEGPSGGDSIKALIALALSVDFVRHLR